LLTKIKFVSMNLPTSFTDMRFIFIINIFPFVLYRIPNFNVVNLPTTVDTSYPRPHFNHANVSTTLVPFQPFSRSDPHIGHFHIPMTSSISK